MCEFRKNGRCSIGEPEIDGKRPICAVNEKYCVGRISREMSGRDLLNQKEANPGILNQKEVRICK